MTPVSIILLDRFIEVACKQFNVIVGHDLTNFICFIHCFGV